MDYAVRRRREIEAWLERYAQDFFKNGFVAGRPTVVMLPGGMGSQLASSIERVDKLGPEAAGFNDVVWIDNGLIFGDPSNPDRTKQLQDGWRLQIDHEGSDHDQFIIAATGPLSARLLGGMEVISPYDATEAWFRERGDNYVVFPYDWRRAVVEGAELLAFFLKQLSRISKGQVLKNLVLLAHSQGGLIAQQFMHAEAEGIARDVGKMITVATPFYGNPNHLGRYVVGDPELNRFYRPAHVSQIVCTLPGPYVLISMDGELFKKIGQVLQGLGQDFPVKDAAGNLVDPFSKTWAGYRPPRIDQTHLDNASAARLRYTRGLDATLAAKVFHLRCGHDANTTVAVTWRFPENQNDDGAVPPARYKQIIEHSYEQVTGRDDGRAGDGTVPYWSARLIETPDQHVYDVSRNVAHMDLMEDQEVLAVVSEIIDRGRLPAVPPQVVGPRRPIPTASDADMAKWYSAVVAGKAPKLNASVANRLLRRSLLA